MQVHLNDPACRFLLLTADPGAGKTALRAWLAHQNPAWLRYFIRRDSRTPLNGFHRQQQMIVKFCFITCDVVLAVDQNRFRYGDCGQTSECRNALSMRSRERIKCMHYPCWKNFRIS